MYLTRWTWPNFPWPKNFILWKQSFDSLTGTGTEVKLYTVSVLKIIDYDILEHIDSISHSLNVIGFIILFLNGRGCVILISRHGYIGF